MSVKKVDGPHSQLMDLNVIWWNPMSVDGAYYQVMELKFNSWFDQISLFRSPPMELIPGLPGLVLTYVDSIDNFDTESV